MDANGVVLALLWIAIIAGLRCITGRLCARQQARLISLAGEKARRVIRHG